MYRHIAIAVSSLGLTVGCYGLSISVEPDTTNLEVSPSTSTQINNAQSPTPQLNPTTTTNTLVSQLPESNQKLITKGTLRISNKTEIPMRIVLLAHSLGEKNEKNIAGKSNKYNLPAHWDFAPQEGSGKGLIVSLPQGTVTLTKGDILVAFAEDGSRRYWGPYVVGETPEPLWNAEHKEWKLILQP
ncbi:MAG: hypothetical protein QNJ36_05940 [Calothrix sp. MO_167.B42]|nr:hypothetical protein [Calothrix sp. MO_167.B42]